MSRRQRLMSPEMELLLLCCRPASVGLHSQRIAALLSEDLDMDGLVRLARFHGLLPRLYSLLSAQGWCRVPAAAAGHLKAFHRENLTRSLAMMRELFRLLDVLAAGPVRALPVKGPVLAVQAYGDPAARAFNDLDLLIGPRDLAEACRLLTGAGYVPEIELSKRDAARYASREKYLVLNHGRTGLAVELQWSYLPGYFGSPDDFDALWGTRRTVMVENRRVPTVSDGETMRFLCLHGFKHGWDRLGLVSDLAHFLSRSQSEPARPARAVSAGLMLVESLAPGTVPGPMLARPSGDACARRLAERWRRDLTAGRTRSRSIFANGLTYCTAQPGFASKLSFLWRLLFSPTVEDWKYWGSGPGPRPYRLLRPLRLMATHAFHRTAPASSRRCTQSGPSS
jgi:hypothetical protein